MLLYLPPYSPDLSPIEVLAVPPLFLQESGHSDGIPMESSGMNFSRRPC